MSADKALRLIAADQVRVQSVMHATTPGGAEGALTGVRARVKGDTGTYDVVFEPLPAGWCCSCPAKGLCSHITAVALVTGTGQ